MAVTRERVFAAADALAAAGHAPSCRSVREALGGGSLTTVSKYLRRWRAQADATAAAVAYLVGLVEAKSADPKLRLDAAKALLRHAGRLADDEAGDADDDAWSELLPR